MYISNCLVANYDDNEVYFYEYFGNDWLGGYTSYLEYCPVQIDYDHLYEVLGYS